MKSINNKRLFGFSVFLGIVLVLLAAGYDHHSRQLPVKMSQLTPDIWVTEQIQPDAIPKLKARGFATLIDLRPDGETDGQPSAQAVESATRANRMDFAYLPVPHGNIPDESVAALDNALATSPRPVLLYCRSGRRAARTWSLAEASRPNGLDAETIQAAVKAAGQSAEDLDAAIRQRIALRPKTTGETK